MDMKKKMPHKNITLKRPSLLHKQSCETEATEAVRKQPNRRLKRTNRRFGNDITNLQKSDCMDEEQLEIVEMKE